MKDHHEGACFNNAWSVELPVQDALTIISTAVPAFRPSLCPSIRSRPDRSGKNEETPLSNLRFNAIALELALLLLGPSSRSLSLVHNIMAPRGGSCAKVPLHLLQAIRSLVRFFWPLLFHPPPRRLSFRGK